MTSRLVLSALLLFSTVAGVKLDDSVTVNGQNLVLNGAGIRKKLFIKVYVGALYLMAKQNNATAILAADAPRRMVMHFVFNVGKGKIAEAWEEGLEDNTPNASADVKANFKTLASWMEDMKSGQQIVLTYVPSTGTSVEVNGHAKGTLAGKPTADAILATWIGPKPGPGGDFKKAVLGK
ncbi:MAG TPA: chalcone isomerase family protein [Thermoanaerobaculia bacterium]